MAAPSTPPLPPGWTDPDATPPLPPGWTDPSAPQPTGLQSWLSSTGGRLARADVVDPLTQLALTPGSMLSDALSYSGKFKNPVSSAIDKFNAGAQGFVDAPFEAANKAARNTPGYQIARAQADKIRGATNDPTGGNFGGALGQSNTPGFLQSLMPQTFAAITGAVAPAAQAAGDALGTSLPFGGGPQPTYADIANATTDSQTAALQKYAQQHPRRAQLANVAGSLVLGPGGTSDALAAAKPTIPSVADLNATADRNYQIVRNSGMQIKGSAIGDLHDNIAAELNKQAFDPQQQPQTQIALNRLKQASGADQNMADLDNMGRIAGRSITNAATAKNGTDAMLSGLVRRRVNEFIDGLPDNLQSIRMPDVGTLQSNFVDAGNNLAQAQKDLAAAQTSATGAAGMHMPGDNVYGASSAFHAKIAADAEIAAAQAKVDAAQAAKDQTLDALQRAQAMGGPQADQTAINALSNARTAYSRASKAQLINDLVGKADLRAQGLKTGNFADQIHNKFLQLAGNDHAMAQFNPAEQAAIRRVATGTGAEKFARTIGMLKPDNPFSLMMELAGAGGSYMATGSLEGALGAAGAMGAGYAGKAAANLMQARNIRAAEELVRSGAALPRSPMNPFSFPSSMAGVGRAVGPLPAFLGAQNVPQAFGLTPFALNPLPQQPAPQTE